MIRFNIIKDSAAAAKYFQFADYVLEDSQTHAFFAGKALDRLGITEFTFNDFEALCHGIDPRTCKVKQDGSYDLDSGKQITPGKKENKRAGYDITIDPDKSISLLWALGRDDRITQALELAGRETMAEIEKDAKTNVRRNKARGERVTGNLGYAGILHTTSRPVNGKVDPNLHFHMVAFNFTYDPEEKRYKALQLQAWEANGAKLDRPYYNAFFNARLAKHVEDLGYTLERTKSGFTVAGVPESVKDEFSQRTAVVEQRAKELGVRSAAGKAKLGATTREPKKATPTLDGLHQHWDSRVWDAELKQVGDTVARSKGDRVTPIRGMEPEALNYSLSHHLQNNSAIPEKKVITEALWHGQGAVEPAKLWEMLRASPQVIGREIKGIRHVSTKQVLNEENAIVDFAVQGKGTKPRLGRLDAEVPEFFTPSQKKAVQQTWASNDRVMLIRGLAGVGKTTALKTLTDNITVPHVAIAPSIKASREGLREGGFAEADTLRKFLNDKEYQQKARNGLIILDEASLAGSRDVHHLTKLADSLNARLLLVGDQKQHKSVPRGDILRLLQDKGLPVATISDIQRQRGTYKNAVKLASEGRAAESFDVLDKLGWVVNSGEPTLQMLGADKGKENKTQPEGYHHLLANDYLKALQMNKTVLAVCPTHKEGEAVTEEIRAKLREAKILRGKDHTLPQLVPVHLTDAEKSQPYSYQPSDVVQFHKRSGKHMQGDRVPWNEARDAKPDAYSVYRVSEIPLAKGDQIRITANGWTKDGEHKLTNGSTYTVDGFTKGGIRLNNGWIVDNSFGHLSHGYVVTSHASQGKTVDQVLIAQGSQSLPATAQDQFYVSISRGRQQATIYTDSKEQLRKAIQRDDTRVLASDLVKKKHHRKKQFAFVSLLTNLARDYAKGIYEQYRRVHATEQAVEKW